MSTQQESSAHEKDPTGRDAHSPGAKLDAGKRGYSVVMGYFPRALAAVNGVGVFGAVKYTLGGWRSVPHGIHRYTEAMTRHITDELAGETNDKDSGLLVAAHTAWNALARLELMLVSGESSAVAMGHFYAPNAKQVDRNPVSIRHEKTDMQEKRIAELEALLVDIRDEGLPWAEMPKALQDKICNAMKWAD